MLLSKNKKVTPDEARSNLSQPERMTVTPGQKILGLIGAFGAALLIVFGISYNYLMPLWSKKPIVAEAPKVAQEEQPKTKPPASLNIAADLAPNPLLQGMNNDQGDL